MYRHSDKSSRNVEAPPTQLCPCANGRTTAVFKLNSDETAQILAREFSRRPRRSREERRATAKEKRNGRIKSIVRKRQGGEKSIEFVSTRIALQSYPLCYTRILFFQQHLRNAVLFRCRGSRILPVAVQNLRELNNFPETNCGCVSSSSRFKRTAGKRRLGILLTEREALPIVSAAAEGDSYIARQKSNIVPQYAHLSPSRDVSQTKLRTSVRLLRQRAARLVLAFAICKSRRARIHTRGITVPRSSRSLSFFRRFASGRPPELDP